MDILHRHTGAVLKTVEGNTLSGANLSGANLSGADLGGANLSWANLSRAKIESHTVTRLAGRTGRSDGYDFFAFTCEDGHVIRAGCRTFTLTEFRDHVAKDYPDTPKSAETLAILAHLEACLSLEAWR